MRTGGSRRRQSISGWATSGSFVVTCLLVLVVQSAHAQDWEWNVNKRKVPAADIDLGASTLARGEMMLGPLLSIYGLLDSISVGTYVLPWFAGVVAPGSLAANVVVKLRLVNTKRWVIALQGHAFYLSFVDVDKDALQLRALIAPLRLLVDTTWTKRVTSTVEFAGVYTTLTGSHLQDVDSEMYGVAAARSLFVGVSPRWRWTPWLALFARLRALVGYAPIAAQARATLSNGTTVEVEPPRKTKRYLLGEPLSRERTLTSSISLRA